MSKFTKTVIMLFVCAALLFCAASCGGSEIDYARIESITVDESSVSGSFLISEFDISDVILNVKYFDTQDATGNTVLGETVQMPATMNMVKAEDKAKLSVPGTKTITLIYGKFEIAVTLTLYESAETKYTVVFLDADGKQLGDPQKVSAGGRATAPALPTVAGYDFIGWKDRDTGNMTGYDNVTKDMYLVAVYAPQYYDVVYLSRTDEGEKEIATVKVPRNASALDYAPAIPIIQGYSNGRWEDTESMEKVNSEGLKFYAIYDRDQVKVGFNYKRFGEASETYYTAYNVGSTVSDPPEAEYDGFKFVEWQLNGKAVTFPYTVTTETVFTAVYIDINTGNDGLQYTYTSGGLQVSGYTGNEDVVVIPETKLIDGTEYPVVEIKDGIFKDAAIREFAVSSTNRNFITDNGVLYNADKTELIAYPSSKALETYTVLPSVTVISPYAFYGAVNLLGIYFGDAVETIGERAFAECINLTGISIPKAVRTIGDYAFEVTAGLSNLLTVTFANNTVLESIGDGAFSGLSSLTEISLPSTLTSLGNGVFAGCSSLALVTAYNNEHFTVSSGMLYSSDFKTLYLYPAVYASASNPDVSVDSRCTRIVSGAFSFAKISGITLNSVLTLDDRAIDCPNLINFRILADGLTFTGSSFASNVPENIYVRAGNATLLNDLQNAFPSAEVKVYDENTWNDSVQYFQNYIYEIYSYEDVVDGAVVTKQGARILGSRQTDERLNIPAVLNNYTVTEIAAKAFYGDNFVKEIYLPADLITIGAQAFANMSKLEYVLFNSVVENIGNEAFADNTLLEKAEYPETLDGITFFGTDVFRNTPFLDDNEKEFVMLGNVLIRYKGFASEVTVPAEVSFIAPSAFSGKGEITSVTFTDNNLKYIAEGAFSHCSGILSVTMPASLEYVADKAFEDCSSLYSVTFGVNNGDERLSLSASAFPTGVTLVYKDTTEFDLIFRIDESETSTVRGAVVAEPLEVDNTAKIRFAGWYLESTFNTLATFPMTLTSNMTLYAKWIDINASTSGLVYELTEDGTYRITGYNGTDGYVIVPATYKNRYVREIADEAFKDKEHVYYIELPNRTDFDGSVHSELTFIGDNVFHNTGWYNNYNGDFVMIDDYLIEYKGTASVVRIPSTVARIAKGAFRDNGHVEKVILPEGLTELDDEVFYGCTGLKEIVLPTTLLQIGYRVFTGCTALKTINFEDCVGLSNVGYDSFDGTAWLNEYVDNCIMINNILYKYKGKGLSSLHVYNGVEIIGERAFADDNVLSSIYLPQSVTSIGKEAFYNSSITAVNLYAGGSNLTSILDGAFKNCSLLSVLDLSLASKLTYIGVSAFENCYALERVTLPATVNTILDYAFAYSGIKSLLFAQNSTLAEIGAYAFYKCTSLFSVSFTDNSALIRIGDYAFAECIALRDFSNPNAALEEIGEGGFYECASLVNFIVKENSLTFIGEGALENVGYVDGDGSNMVVLGNILVKYNGFDTVVTIPDNITTIYNGAFKGNSKITQVIFGESSRLNAINSNAFDGCVNLSDIVFPATLTRVGDDVMKDTAWLNDKLLDGEEFIIIANTLIKYNSSVKKQVVLPAEVQVINAGAFGGTSPYDIKITDNILRIADGAFDGIIGEWTLTVEAAIPPTMEEKDLLGAKKILFAGADEMDTYRLDAGWGVQESLMTVVNKYKVTFVVDADKAQPIDEAYYYAIYSEIEVETKQGEGDTEYIFIGWYFDEGFTNKVTYPYYLTEDTRLYAKCIDNAVGSPNDQYTVENNVITKYFGTTDSKIVIMGEQAGEKINGIDKGYINDPEGDYIKDGNNYIYNTTDPTTDRYSYVGPFQGHAELTEVYFTSGSSISYIGKDSFKDCVNLTKVVLPLSIKTIDSGAFAGCVNLREIVFPEGVSQVRIESGAFEGCTALESLTLPEGISYLGEGAFAGCTSLNNIYMEAEIALVIGVDVKPFEITENLRIHIPYNSYNSYSSTWTAYKDYFVEQEQQTELPEGDEN